MSTCVYIPMSTCVYLCLNMSTYVYLSLPTFDTKCDARIFRCQSCCSDCIFYSVKGTSACLAIRAAQEQSGSGIDNLGCFH